MLPFKRKAVPHLSPADPFQKDHLSHETQNIYLNAMLGCSGVLLLLLLFRGLEALRLPNMTKKIKWSPLLYNHTVDLSKKIFCYRNGHVLQF